MERLCVCGLVVEGGLVTRESGQVGELYSGGRMNKAA